MRTWQCVCAIILGAVSAFGQGQDVMLLKGVALEISNKVKVNGGSAEAVIVCVKGADKGLLPVLEAELARTLGKKIYTRDQKQLQAIEDEIGFLAEYEDIVKNEALLKDGELQISLGSSGVCLLAEVRSFSAGPKQGYISVLYTLLEYKTGRKLTSGIAESRYPDNAQVSYLADRDIRKAGTDAAYQVAYLLRDDLKVKRIALLPFENDAYNIGGLVHSEISGRRFPTRYTLLSRSPADWKKLIAEHNFATNQGGMMDAASIPRAGKILGAEAILSGRVLNVQKGAAETAVTVELTLLSVETNELLQKIEIEGIAHHKFSGDQDLDADVVTAADKLIQTIGDQVRTRVDLDGAKAYDVYLLSDRNQPGASKYLLNRFVGQFTSVWNFYDLSSWSQHAGLYSRIMSDLSGPFGKGNPVSLGIFSGRAPAAKRKGLAGLSVDITSVKVVDGQTKFEPRQLVLTAGFKLRDLASGQVLFSDTQTGKAAVLSADQRRVIEAKLEQQHRIALEKGEISWEQEKSKADLADKLATDKARTEWEIEKARAQAKLNLDTERQTTQLELEKEKELAGLRLQLQEANLQLEREQANIRMQEDTNKEVLSWIKADGKVIILSVLGGILFSVIVFVAINKMTRVR